MQPTRQPIFNPSQGTPLHSLFYCPLCSHWNNPLLSQVFNIRLENKKKDRLVSHLFIQAYYQVKLHRANKLDNQWTNPLAIHFIYFLSSQLGGHRNNQLLSKHNNHLNDLPRIRRLNHPINLINCRVHHQQYSHLSNLLLIRFLILVFSLLWDPLYNNYNHLLGNLPCPPECSTNWSAK